MISAREVKRQYEARLREAFSDTMALLGAPQELQFGLIGDKAIRSFEDTWRDHPSRKVDWDWGNRSHRAIKGFNVAIWHGEVLCGLASGPTKSKVHTSIRMLEGNPGDHPIKGMVIPIALMTLEQYAKRIGVPELRLMEAARPLIPAYEKAGFSLAPQLGHPHHMRRAMSR